MAGDREEPSVVQEDMSESISKRPDLKNRLTSEEAAALYGVPVEQFIIWWMHGEVPFRRIVEGGHNFFLLHDPERGLPPETPPTGPGVKERLLNAVRRLGTPHPID